MIMAEKRRYTVSLPDHVADEIERYAKAVGAPPTEYVGDIVRWWFGIGAPPVTKDEEQIRGTKTLDIWQLDPLASYYLTDDTVVAGLMKQLGVPNLFAPINAEHDLVHSMVAFEDHPSHWIVLHIWKGLPAAKDNGLLLEAFPKASTSRQDMLAKLEIQAREIHNGDEPVKFSQLPVRSQKSRAAKVPTTAG